MQALEGVARELTPCYYGPMTQEEQEQAHQAWLEKLEAFDRLIGFS